MSGAHVRFMQAMSSATAFFRPARLFHDLQLSPVVHAQQRLDVQHAAHGGGSRAVSSVPDIPDEKPRYSTSYPLWSASSNAAR